MPYDHVTTVDQIKAGLIERGFAPSADKLFCFQGVMVAIFDEQGTTVVMQVDRSGQSILEYEVTGAIASEFTLACRTADRALFGAREGTTIICADVEGAVDALISIFRRPPAR